MRYMSRAAVSVFDFFRVNLATELRRVEAANSLGSGILTNPVWYFGVHPQTPDPVAALVYVTPEGLEPMGDGAGQRLQRHITQVALELRLQGPQPVPTVGVEAQGEPGAFGENTFYELYAYADACVGMLEPRSSDAAGTNWRPSLGNRVTVARLDRVVLMPETQDANHVQATGFTMRINIQTTDDFVG